MRRSRRSTDRAQPSARARGRSARLSSERGSASLEFLTIGMLLLVPLVYLVLAVAAIQAGALGVEGAARQAARIAVTTVGRDATDAAVDRAVRITLADYGIDADAASVTVACDRAECSEPGARVRVSVATRVVLPLVPDVLSLTAIGSVPIEASATQTVSRFAGATS